MHLATCGYVKMHGGESITNPPTGEYYGGLPTLEAARERASRTRQPNVRLCRARRNTLQMLGERLDAEFEPGHRCIRD